MIVTHLLRVEGSKRFKNAIKFFDIKFQGEQLEKFEILTKQALNTGKWYLAFDDWQETTPFPSSHSQLGSRFVVS